MAKLCFAIRSSCRENGYDSSLPRVLSFHRSLRNNLLGLVKLSKDGTIRVGGEFAFPVVDAYFLSPDCYHRVIDNIPRIVVDTDISPMLAKLCAKYSKVVELRAPRIAGDSISATIKLCASDPAGQKDVFCFIKDVLEDSSVILSSVSVKHEADRELAIRLIGECGKFVDRYIRFYVRKAAIGGYAVFPEGGRGSLHLSSRFFTHSIDGRTLLRDECEYGLLSMLRSNASDFLFMYKKLNREFVIAAFEAIEGMGEYPKSFIIADDPDLTKRSFVNLCVASTFSSGAHIHHRVVKHIMELLNSENMRCALDVVREALEVLAIYRAFTGDNVLKKGDLGRILEVDSNFLSMCSKYEDVACRLQFPIGCHVRIKAEQEVGNIDLLLDLLSKYENAYDCVVSYGLSGRELLGNAISSRPLTQEKKKKVKTVFADFCLAEAYQWLLAAAVPHNKIDVVNLGDRVSIDNRISGIYVNGFGDIIDTNDALISVTVDREATRGCTSQGMNDVKHARSFYAVVAFSVMLASLVSVVLLLYLPVESVVAVTLCVLVPVFMIPAIVAATARAIFASLWNKKPTKEIEKPELYLCVNFKNDAVFNSVRTRQDAHSFRFSEHGLYVDGNMVPCREYKVSLVDENTMLGGKSTLFRIKDAEEQRSGLALLRAIAATVGGMQITKLLITEASPSCSVGYVLKCRFKLSTRESYLRVAEVFAKAGRPSMLLAYLDSYVALSCCGDRPGVLSECFLKSSAYKLLCMDQSYWKTFDTILHNCSRHIVGDRRMFVDNILLQWKDGKIPMRVHFPFLYVRSPGFPFDRQELLQQWFKPVYEGVDRYERCLTEEVLVDFDEVLHTLDGERLSLGEGVCDEEGPATPETVVRCASVALPQYSMELCL